MRQASDSSGPDAQACPAFGDSRSGSTPIERMARDARIQSIGGGATEVMLDEIAKRMC